MKHMRRTILLPAVAALCSVQAQQINGYRYWFDDNASAAVTTSVGSTNELVLNTTLPASALSSGFHRLNVQVRDTDGTWSVPLSRSFTRVSQSITAYRYWVNDNTASIGTGTPSPGQVVDLNGLLDLAALPKDLNTVTIQFRDGLNEWSVPIRVWFVRNTGPVNGYEWWIDDAIADAFTGSIGPNGVVDLIAELPTGVPAGFHTFTIRFSSTNGAWSVPLSSAFESFVGIAELPGITELLLFPNPVSDQLGLRLSTDAARTLNLQVLDLSGALAADLSTWSVSGTTYQNWDISALASGSYLLRISGDQGAWTTRFVKP